MRRSAAGLALVLVLFGGCSKPPNAPPTRATLVDATEERVTITDEDGKVWDITHAVREYGFDPQLFEYGVGVDAFPAVMDPTFVGPGEPGYPHEDATRMVLGATFFGDARAYGIAAMSYREVINDVWNGDTYLAVAY